MTDRDEMDSAVKQVLAGDVECYSVIIRAFQQEVWRVVAAMLLNRSQTEDLVQQTFVAAYHHLHQYRAGHDFGAWIKQIARNCVRQELRARGRELQRLESYYAHLTTTFGEEVAEPSAYSAALKDCTAQLPPESARVVELRYEKGCDFTQIAQVLGRSVEAARQHLARIRLVLRDCIEKRLAHS